MTALQIEADAAATALGLALGKALRDARTSAGLSQVALARKAGLAQTTVSLLERGKKANISLVTWSRAARAAEVQLHAYLSGASSADQPRDAVHLRAQELVIQTASPGGWKARPEAAIDIGPQSSRSVDVLLERSCDGCRREIAVFEVWDWLDDVGGAFRSWDKRLARVDQLATARMVGDELLPTVSGCWVLRDTRRNRDLVAHHAGIFGARFPGDGRAWLAALGSAAPMPRTPALLWISVRGDRLTAARFGTRDRPSDGP